MASLPSGTVTFLFTDIEGSTKLAQGYPDTWESLRERHHAILQSAMAAYHGYVFQIIGDAFCVAFHNVGNGLSAAVEAQRELIHADWGERPIKVRMGLHTGSAELNGNDYRGYLTLAKVQRIMSVACGGQILVSSASSGLLHNELPAGISLRDMKEHRLKGLPHRERLWQIVVPGIEQDFPPIQSSTETPNNLPTQLTSFVGRRKELEDVKTLLQTTPMLTLIGPGGAGKTRLSIQAAGDLLDHYIDGIWLVELAPIFNPLLVPRTTSMAIGLRDEPKRPVIDMLCDYLHDKKMLIVLDNCEHLVHACAQMTDRILHAAQNVRILASSREALGIAGELTYRVPSLGLPDVNHLPPLNSLNQYEAVKLFVDRATVAIQTFHVTNDNAPALAQICYRLDGIPLAIELAAAKTRVLSVEQIAKRLDDRFKLLTGGSRTALEHHQTLRAAIDWSYNLLPPEEQILFRRLSIFVNGWSLEAAESVCADDSVKSDAVLDLLEHLVNKSMVLAEQSQHETRYRILETLRQYANEKLVESGETDAVRNKHLDYFLNLTEQAAPHLIRAEQLEWLTQLDAEYENLRAALEWALSKESAELSLRLCGALGRYWYMRTFWLEGSKWLQSALSKTRQDSNPVETAARVKALYTDAELADQLDDLDRMKNSAHSSLSLAEKVSNPLDITIARFQVASELYRRWDNDNSLVLLEQCLAEFQKLKQLYWEFRTYNLLSNILITQGKLKYSEKWTQALVLARKAEERQSLADALEGYSEWMYSLNRLEEALRYAEEADVLLKQIGSTINWTSYIFAEAALSSGNYKEAKSQYLAIQKRFGVLGEKNIGSVMSANLGLVALEQGELDQALMYFEESLAIAREVNTKPFIASRLAEIGITYYLQGNIEKYKQNFRECSLMAKGISIYHKRHILLLLLNFVDFQKSQAKTLILGALNKSEKESDRPINPANKRYYNHAETQAREKLGDAAFESGFAEGCEMSLDDALDLALAIVEEM